MWVGTLRMSRHCLGQEGGERGIPGRGNRGAAAVASRRVEGAEAALRKGWGGWSRGPRGPALPSQDESPSRGRRHATRRSLTRVVVGTQTVRPRALEQSHTQRDAVRGAMLTQKC